MPSFLKAVYMYVPAVIVWRIFVFIIPTGKMSYKPPWGMQFAKYNKKHHTVAKQCDVCWVGYTQIIYFIYR